jgi:hypothetical protein
LTAKEAKKVKGGVVFEDIHVDKITIKTPGATK